MTTHTLRFQTTRYMLGILIYIVAIAIGLKCLNLLLGYFTDEYRHPITFVTDLFGLTPAFPKLSEVSFFDGFMKIILGILTALFIYLYSAIGSVVIAADLYSRITLGKSGYAAYRAEKKKNATPKTVELGTLISVTVGGSVSTIETDQGFYFIHGIPDALKAGSAVRQVGNDIVFDHGQGNTKHYPLATKNEVN